MHERAGIVLAVGGTHMSLDRYRRPRLVVLLPRQSAFDAARAMADHRVGSVLVGGGGRLAGIVTDRDLAVRVTALGLDPRVTMLRDVMSQPIVHADVRDSVSDAARAMRERGCRRLPITEDGEPVGMVTLDDLILDGEIQASEARAVLIAQIDRAFPAHGPGRVDDEGPHSARRRRAS